MTTQIRLSGCGMMLVLILAACGTRETPLAPEDGAEPDLTPVAAAAAAAVRFEVPQQWGAGFCRKGEVCLIGDFDRNGKDDAIAFNHGVDGKNAVYVARSSGAAFGSPEKWSTLFCRSTETCAVGDVSGDGRADVIAFTRGTAKDVWVALSNGVSFGAPQKWSDFFCKANEVCKVTDVNGDGIADLIAFRHGINGDNSVYVAYSQGEGFGPARQVSSSFCLATETCEVGPVIQGFGYNELIAFTRDPNNEVWVSHHNAAGNIFQPPARWSLFFCRTGEVCQVEDFNGDRLFDAIAFNHGLGGANAVFVATSNGSNGFGPAVKVIDKFCTKSQTCAVGDVTGDGRADVIAFTRGTTPQAWVGMSLP